MQLNFLLTQRLAGLYAVIPVDYFNFRMCLVSCALQRSSAAATAAAKQSRRRVAAQLDDQKGCVVLLLLLIMICV